MGFEQVHASQEAEHMRKKINALWVFLRFRPPWTMPTLVERSTTKRHDLRLEWIEMLLSAEPFSPFH